MKSGVIAPTLLYHRRMGQGPIRIYVDAPIHRWRGQRWCHVFSPDIAALHAFMASIGSRREWFQDPATMEDVSWPHYDANEKRRAAAIAAGAVPLGRHQTVVMAKLIKARCNGSGEDPLASHRERGSPMLKKLEEWLDREIPKESSVPNINGRDYVVVKPMTVIATMR